MRVICIDNKPRNDSFDKESLSRLNEGDIYTVIGKPHPVGIFLKEVSTLNPSGFYVGRFIPCGEIDELELVKERELITT